jgi:hypothetical protein
MTGAEFWLQHLISEQKKSQEQHKVEKRLRKEDLAKEAAAAKAKKIGTGKGEGKKRRLSNQA